MAHFLEVLQQFDDGPYLQQWSPGRAPASIDDILQKPKISFEDFAILISPAAGPFLENIAQRAQVYTRRRFGQTMQLFAPLYLSNECTNVCVYCGFNRKNRIKRKTLSVDEIKREAAGLQQRGFNHILLVCGEAPSAVSLAFLEDAIRIFHDNFASVSLEIYPQEKEEYRRLMRAGADGLVLYQETYLPLAYSVFHPSGKKADFSGRLQAMENAGAAGFHRLGIGALLGLAPWRQDALRLARHAAYLQDRYWRSFLTVSFPRLREAPGNFTVPFPVSDTELVQLICALRLFLPDAGMVLSTRESPWFRDHLAGIGITSFSAESKTAPGGYAEASEAGEQFHISDSRPLVEIKAMLSEKGFDPVSKDWDRGFIP
jgi:2-iminoacetate synthase